MTSRTTRRKFLRATLISCAGAWLAACQPKAAPVVEQPTAPPEATKAPAVKPTNTAKPTSDKLPVKVWMSDDWSGQADKFVKYEKYVQDCADEIGLEVEYRVVDYTTIGQQVPLIMASGKYTADIVPGGSMDVITYGRQGQLLDMRPYVPEELLDAMVPSLRELGELGDNLYSLTVWPSWIIGFYNQNLYESAGLDPERGPGTLVEMEDQITALQKVTNMPYLDTWHGADILRVFRNLVYAKDGSTHKGATKGNPDEIEWTFSAPECREALAWIKHMYDEKLVSPDSLQLTQQDIAERFGQGDVGMTTNWDGFASISEKPGSSVEGKVGAFGWPGDSQGKGVAYYYDEVMLMPASAKNPEGAGQWIECIEKPSIVKARAIDQYFNPIYTDLYDDPEVQEALFYWKVIQEVAPRTIPINYHASRGEVYSFLTTKVQEVLLGQIEIDAALAEADKFAAETVKAS